MTDRLALPRRYRDQLEALLSEHVPDVEVWAYGSRVNGESHEGSDLDLALRGPALEPLDGGFYDLLEAIEKSNIPILVQAHDWAMLPESFHREIERDYVVVQEGVGKQTTAGEWCEVTLGEVLTLQRGFDLPTTQRKPGSYPVIASTGPVGTHGEAMVRGPGVVIGRSGSLGGGQFVEHDFWPLNTTLWVKDFKGNNPRFCYYLLKSIDLAQFNVGSGVPTLNRNHIHPFPVARPPLPTQRAIAHVLGTLDDKIELNRRMNETLEGMARALFKSWFVDFEPVRAKMDGRWWRGESLPGLPADLYNLFPDRLVDSELGDVPKGWEVKALDSIATFLNGLALQKYPATDGSALPVIKIAQIRAGHTIGADSASSHLPPQYVVHDGDVLFSWSGSLELNVWTGGEGALNQHLFKVTSQAYPKWLYYRWVGEHLRGFRAIAAGKTTTMGHIQRHHLSEALTVIPDAAMLKAMDRYMQSLLGRSLALRIESRALATQRDALLPRLVLGEAGVGNSNHSSNGR